MFDKFVGIKTYYLLSFKSLYFTVCVYIDNEINKLGNLI